MPAKWTSLCGSVDSSQLSGRDQILFITSSPHHPKQINNLFVTGAAAVEAAYFNAWFIITVFEGKKLSKLAHLSPFLIKKCLEMKVIFNVLIKIFFVSPCINSNLFHFPPSGHFGLTDPVAWIMSSGPVISANERLDPNLINQ